MGLKTNETNYYWRIGNFSLSDPSTVVSLKGGDRNRCGTIGKGEEDRWDLKKRNKKQDCTVCMKGKQTV